MRADRAPRGARIPPGARPLSCRSRSSPGDSVSRGACQGSYLCRDRAGVLWPDRIRPVSDTLTTGGTSCPFL